MIQADSPFVTGRVSYWEKVLHLGAIRSYAAGSVIYRMGEPSNCLYYLMSGRVAISLPHPSGSEKILAIIEAGNTFGESAALDGLPAYVTATAVVSSRACAFLGEEVLAAMGKDPDLAREVLRALIRKQRLMAMQVDAMAFLRAPARVCLMLARLTAAYGRPLPAGQGKRLGIRMTHAELAGMLGISRVTVSRVIGDLLGRGILKKDKWDLMVLDEERLWQMATDEA